MREQLIGYLLDSLEADERDAVEQALEQSPALRQDLEQLSVALHPLKGTKEEFDPPPGLAERTCAAVANRGVVQVAPPVSSAPSRWSAADMIVAAAMLMALSMLFVPALNQSRYLAQLSQCQDRLRQLGVALASYSGMHEDYFPKIESQGPLAKAGVVAPQLSKLVDNHDAFVCPGSPAAKNGKVCRVPHMEQFASASMEEQSRMQQAWDSYAYNLGYMKNGVYQSPKNLHRPRFAMMADAPAAAVNRMGSLHHQGRGQNVLYEDGHVSTLCSCQADDALDNIYLNEHEIVAAGDHCDDAVLAPSHFSPLPRAK